MANAAAKPPKHAPSTKLVLDDVLKSLQDLIRNDLPEVRDDATLRNAAEPAPVPHADPGTPQPTAKDLILELEAGLADLTLPDTAPTQPVVAANPSVPAVEPAITLPATGPVTAKAAGPEGNGVTTAKAKTPARPPSPQLAALLADLAAFGSAPGSPASTVTPAPDTVPPAKPAAAKAAGPGKQKDTAPKTVTQAPTPPPLQLAIAETDLIPLDANPAPVPRAQPAITPPVAAKAAGPEKKTHPAAKTTALPLAPPSLDAQVPLPRVEGKRKDTPSPGPVKGVRQALDPAAPQATAPPQKKPPAEPALRTVPGGGATTSRPPGAMRAEPAPASPTFTPPRISAGAPPADDALTLPVAEFPQDESVANIDLDALDGVQPRDNPAAPGNAAFLQDEPASDIDLDTLHDAPPMPAPVAAPATEFLQEEPAAATELAALDGVHLDFSDHGDTFAIERDQSLSTAPDTHAPTEGLSWHTPELSLSMEEPVDATLSSLHEPVARRAPGGVQSELPFSQPAPAPPAAGLELAPDSAVTPPAARVPAPDPPLNAEDGDIPLLQDVIDAVEMSTSAARASALTRPTAEQARRMAIQVAARLNVELRRSGKRTLSSDIITRLARMLQETLAQSPSNVDNKPRNQG